MLQHILIPRRHLTDALHSHEVWSCVGISDLTYFDKFTIMCFYIMYMKTRHDS